MSQREAFDATAGLSSPGKMPCHSYGLPAAECNVGSRLRAASTADAPTICGECYALKGSYRMYPEVIPAQYRRLSTVRAALTDPDARERWVTGMVALIGWTSRDSRVFRWHDSGDLQSADHLTLIAEVCDRLPWVRFWIPTRESRVVRDWTVANGPLPANLCVRESVALVDHFPRHEDRDDARVFSGAAQHAPVPATAHACPAYRQNGECGECRACWDTDTTLVIYPLH